MPDKKQIIEVQGTSVTIIQVNQSDYISLTNIARHKNPNEPKDIVKNWMRSKTTIEFLGLWVALFGKTAKQWREQNPDKQGNIRDEAPLLNNWWY